MSCKCCEIKEQIKSGNITAADLHPICIKDETKKQLQNENPLLNEDDVMKIELHCMFEKHDALFRQFGQVTRRVDEIAHELTVSGISESKKTDLKIEGYDLYEKLNKIIKYIGEINQGISESTHILGITGDSKSSEAVVLRTELHKYIKKNTELLQRVKEIETSYEFKMAEMRGRHAQELNDIKSGSATDSTAPTAPTESESATGQADGAAMVTSPSTPSSTNPIVYDKKKRYYLEKTAECEEQNGGFKPDPKDPSKCIYCHRPHIGNKPIGPPPDHEGHDVSWKPSRCIRIAVKACKCGWKKLRKLKPISKLIIDFDGNSRFLKVIQYLREKKYCSKCKLIITAPEPGVPGTFIGKNLAAVIVASAGNSDRYASILHNVRAITKKKLSENTIRRCVQAVVETSLESSMPEIMEELKRASFVQFDETYIRVNGKRGYVWIARTDRATFVVATTTRSSEIIPTFFGALIGKYAVVDGYAAYPRFVKVQRCWSHELLHAERLAINGGVGSLHDKLFDEMRRIYYAASVLAIKGGATDKQIEQLKDDMRVLIAKYGDHPIAGRFGRALDSLFVALRVPGMYLHNNHTEADIRKLVIYRKLHHQFKTERGRNVFSVLQSFVGTANKIGIFSADAILCKINYPGWSLFGDSDTKPAPGEPTYRPPTDAERARIERDDAKYRQYMARRKATSDKKAPATTDSTAQTVMKTENEKHSRHRPRSRTRSGSVSPKSALYSCVMAQALLCIVMSVLGGTYLVSAMTATASIKFQNMGHAQTTCPSQQPWPPPYPTKPTRTQTCLRQGGSQICHTYYT